MAIPVPEERPQGALEEGSRHEFNLAQPIGEKAMRRMYGSVPFKFRLAFLLRLASVGAGPSATVKVTGSASAPAFGCEVRGGSFTQVVEALKKGVLKTYILSVFGGKVDRRTKAALESRANSAVEWAIAQDEQAAAKIQSLFWVKKPSKPKAIQRIKFRFQGGEASDFVAELSASMQPNYVKLIELAVLSKADEVLALDPEKPREFPVWKNEGGKQVFLHPELSTVPELFKTAEEGTISAELEDVSEVEELAA